MARCSQTDECEQSSFTKWTFLWHILILSYLWDCKFKSLGGKVKAASENLTLFYFIETFYNLFFFYGLRGTSVHQRHSETNLIHLIFKLSASTSAAETHLELWISLVWTFTVGGWKISQILQELLLQRHRQHQYSCSCEEKPFPFHWLLVSTILRTTFAHSALFIYTYDNIIYTSSSYYLHPCQ